MPARTLRHKPNDRFLVLRITPADRELVRRAAVREGIPLSTYVKRVALRDAARLERRAA